MYRFSERRIVTVYVGRVCLSWQSELEQKAMAARRLLRGRDLLDVCVEFAVQPRQDSAIALSYLLRRGCV
jgi:hypothetical protein